MPSRGSKVSEITEVESAIFTVVSCSTSFTSGSGDWQEMVKKRRKPAEIARNDIKNGLISTEITKSPAG
jgi:hypothetical protein